MKWKNVFIKVKGVGILRGEEAKRWIIENLQPEQPSITKLNDNVWLKFTGGHPLIKLGHLRDALIWQSKGQVVDFGVVEDVERPVSDAPNTVRLFGNNVIKSRSSRLAMHLDVDRDGRVDDEPANNVEWAWGLASKGAIILPKLKVYDNPEDLVLERAEIQLRWAGTYLEGWTASLSVDKPEKVRVYGPSEGYTGQQHGAQAVIEQRETNCTYQLDELPGLEGASHSAAINIEPKVAIEGCEGMAAKLTGQSFPDEATFKTACQEHYLPAAHEAYKRHHLNQLEPEIAKHKATLEQHLVIGKKLNFGAIRKAAQAIKESKRLEAAVRGLQDQTVSSWDDLVIKLNEAAAEKLMVPGPTEFLGRLDELWGRIAAAAKRPEYDTKASFDLQPGVAAFDAIHDSNGTDNASLWIEAVAFPEVTDDTQWEVTLTFRFTPPTGRGDEVEQSAVVRIAPWLMANDLDPTEVVYVKDLTDEPLDIAASIQAFATTAGSESRTTLAQRAATKGFCRDLIKSGYATAPHYQVRVVMTGLDQQAGLSIVPSGPDIALLDRRVGAGTGSSQDNGGNYMVSPPTEQHPFGRIIYGHQENFECNHAGFLDAQRVQSAIRIDSTWLKVGHVDEMLAFLPDRSSKPNPKWPFKLLFANSRLALLMLLEVAAEANPATADVAAVIARAVKKHEEHRETTIDEKFIATHYPATEAVTPAAGFELPNERGLVDDGNIFRTSARDYFNSHRELFLDFARKIQPVIDNARATLIRELEIDEGDVLDVPVLFHGKIPVTGDSVNMLVLSHAEATHCLVPKPFGPVVSGAYVFEKYLHDKLTELEVTFEFLNDWADFHLEHGEIHCGTNQLPRPLADYQWWHMAAPDIVQHAGTAGASATDEVHNETVEVVGFQNMGNTCYLASTLQVLIHSTYVDTVAAIASMPLRNVVTNYRNDAANGTYTRVDEQVRYTRSVIGLRDELVTSIQVGVGTQEDPSQVWGHLLDTPCLDQQVQLQLRRRYTVPNPTGPGPTVDVTELDAEGWVLNPDVQDHSLVIIPPGGHPTLDQAVAAAWNRPGPPDVSLHEAHINGTIYQDLPLAQEVTSWHGNAPQRFVLQLARFEWRDGAPHKITAAVQVTPQLTIGGIQFELRGVIEHIGGFTNVGHYVAYVKERTNNNWFRADDTRIEHLAEQAVLDRAKVGYLFYFER
ncbi:protein-arginine deiminase family protein [Enhygromyxa salina]|uniref:Protein-arginine deiminase n=1 Tax=Enhygromyxa salina TaxID=215803 RepID=A0A2S9Y0H6_9BACT|nr:protein-arginine deiminase family protein [Enhygromyxa salina]PRP98596.1 Protein-arginine deiminase [Enhygromyxa salina]